MKSAVFKSIYNTGSSRWISSSTISYQLTKATSASKEEVSHFNSLASTWWDVNGPQRILHKMNLLRVDFINDNLRNHVRLQDPRLPLEEQIYVPPYSLDLLPHSIRAKIIEDQENKRDDYFNKHKLSVLDVGCGGGILSESLARLNFIESVQGIDLSPEVIEAAKIHKQKDPLLADNDRLLSYEVTPLEEIPADSKYDIVTMFEILEHVPYPSKVLGAGLEKLKPKGWLFLSTINRDFVSWFTTIFMGEHILKIVPVGTHTLNKYIDCEEIEQWIKEDSQVKDKFEIIDAKGCTYLPSYGWRFTDNPKIGNYFMAIQKV